MRPSFAKTVRPKKTEGAGNAGRSLHPQSRVRNKIKHTSVVTTGSDGFNRHSPRNGFNGFLRALLGDHAVLPPSSCGYGFVQARLGRLASARLDASIGASEPHDFAVRFSIFRPARRSIAHRPCPPALHHVACPMPPRPPHPIPTFVTMANAPLWDRTRRISEVIWVRREEKYFCKRGWTGFQRTD